MGISLEEERILAVRRWDGDNEVLTIFNFDDYKVRPFRNVPNGVWHKLLDSADSRWLGGGAKTADSLDASYVRQITLAPHSVVLFEKEFTD